MHNSPTKSDPHGFYGALVEGYAVCGGYSNAYKILGLMAGLDVRYVPGYTSARENHAWNLVKIDGKFYHTDVTWNDLDREPQSEEDKRFMRIL